MKNQLAKPFIAYLDSINFEDKSVIEVLKTKEKKFGDYTSNISLRLTKALGKKPMDIAEEIKTFISENFKEDFTEVTATAPGFVNLFLSPKFIVGEALKFVDTGYKPEFDGVDRIRILYEFVSANPTGDLHIGHARNAIVGDIVIKALRYIGHEVDAEYYINDGGNQIQVLAESIYFYMAKFGNFETNLDQEAVGYHGQEIKDYAQKMIDEGFELKGETEEEKINSLKETAGKDFLEVIKNLLIEMGVVEMQAWASEKELIETKVGPLFDKLKSMDAIYESEGATWIKVSEFGDEKDRVLVKANGLYTYMVPDLAYHMQKYERGYDLIIDLWGKDHHGYEPRIQAGLKSMGYENKLEVDYISMVQIMNGGEVVKMSKRAGTSFRIKDALRDLPADLLRFFIVSKAKEQEMEIDINIAAQNDMSNPYFYVQYTNARVAQIISKYNEEVGEIPTVTSFDKLGLDEKERDLMVKMNEFEDIILSINADREPSLIINYVKDLSQEFNSYYSSVRVITEDAELTSQRINLVVALRNQLKTIFNIIGITPKDKV